MMCSQTLAAPTFSLKVNSRLGSRLGSTTSIEHGYIQSLDSDRMSDGRKKIVPMAIFKHAIESI